MAVDQQSDEQWKTLLRNKLGLVDEWRIIIDKWLNESDGTARAELMEQEKAMGQRIATANRALDEYVNMRGGY